MLWWKDVVDVVVVIYLVFLVLDGDWIFFWCWVCWGFYVVGWLIYVCVVYDFDVLVIFW